MPPASPPTAKTDVRDLAIAVWNARRPPAARADREGVSLPYRPETAGFVDLAIAGEPWRIYYLQSFDGDWLVAAGPEGPRREELALDVTLGRALPWLATLPLLLLMASRCAAPSPLRGLSDELRARRRCPSCRWR